MRDWAGSRVQQDALTVPCAYCHAPIGQLCRNEISGEPLRRFPAHTIRITQSEQGEEHP